VNPQSQKPSVSSSPRIGDDSRASLGTRPARLRDLSFQVRDLLHRTNVEPGTLPVEGREDLIVIPEDDVEEMVKVLATATRECVEKGKLEDNVARALSMGFPLVTGREAAPEETLAVAQAVARFGFMARVTEWERLTTARKPAGWMIAGLQGAVESSVAEELREADDGEKSFYDALAEVTAFFVRREPLDVPYDANQGFVLMWTIPGVGGEVRALLREQTLPMVLEHDAEGLKGPAGPIEGAAMEDFQRIWKYGFLLRSFEEFFREDY
jgi:hypothetical protein